MLRILRRAIRVDQKSSPKHSIHKDDFKPNLMPEPSRNLYELMKRKSIKILEKYPVIICSNNDLKINYHYYKGCDVTVCGSENDTYGTAASLVEFFEEKNPIQVILDLNVEALESLNKNIYQNTPVSSVSVDHLLGRKRAMQFLCNDIYFTKDYVKDPEEPIVLRYKEKDSIVVADMNLTAMHTGALFSIAKMFFSRPPELLMLEDLVLNFDVVYLKNVLYEVLKTLNRENIPEGIVLPLGREAILADIRAAAQTKFGNSLFKKKALFQCAVMEKFSRPSEKALMHTNYDQAGILSKLM